MIVRKEFAPMKISIETKKDLDFIEKLLYIADRAEDPHRGPFGWTRTEWKPTEFQQQIRDFRKLMGFNQNETR